MQRFLAFVYSCGNPQLQIAPNHGCLSLEAKVSTTGYICQVQWIDLIEITLHHSLDRMILQELSRQLPDDCKGSIEAMACDIGKVEDIMSLFEAIKNKYGGVDICVNNAGIAINAPLLSGSTEDWIQMLNVSVKRFENSIDKLFLSYQFIN